MKILYLSRAKIPNYKAHVLQIHKMCDAFQAEGATVELFHPREPGGPPDPDSLRTEYDLSEPLTYRTIPCINLKWLRNHTRRLGFWLYAYSYCFLGLIPVIWAFLRSEEEVIAYSRDRLFSYLLLYLKPLLRIPVIMEFHDLPDSLENGIRLNLIHRADGLVTISKALAEDLSSRGLPRDEIIVQPDGVDPAAFDLKASRSELRENLDLPRDDSLVGFVGNLYSYNGPETILELADRLSEVTVVVVGGSDSQLETYRSKKESRGLENLRFEGFQPHRLIPRYLKAFDVLLLPLQPAMDRTLKYCSPLKLFEYLCAGRPLVASDLPALREILVHDQNALLVDPGEAGEFARAVRRLLGNPELAETLATNAKRTSSKYSWGNRARAILKFIRQAL